MQLVVLVTVNIVLASIFYLVISLKLERSASEFREKKLRKEMDEIIREFNATAERNISILENRITMIKRLLEKSGDMKSIDIVLGDKEKINESGGKPDAGHHIEENADRLMELPPDEDIPAGGIMVRQPGMPDMQWKRHGLTAQNLLHDIRAWLVSFFDRGHRDPVHYRDPGPGNITPLPGETRPGIDLHDSNELITRDLVRPGRVDDEYSVLTDPDVPDDEEIEQLISSSGNKYTLVAELSSRGLTAEAIAESSGIPVGEVRLVLNLNNSR